MSTLYQVLYEKVYYWFILFDLENAFNRISKLVVVILKGKKQSWYSYEKMFLNKEVIFYWYLKTNDFEKVLFLVKKEED